MKLYQDQDWLYQKYIIEEYSASELSELLEVDDETIRRWLRKFGIPIRNIQESACLDRHIKNVSASVKGRAMSPESRKKLSIALTGKKRTPEQIERNRQAHLGQKCTPETKEKMRIAHMGDKNSQWKGGRIITYFGYVIVLCSEHPNANCMGYVPEQRLIAEKALGRHLRKNEIVHHINGNKLDNRNCNLLVCTRGYHMWLHGKMQKGARA